MRWPKRKPLSRQEILNAKPFRNAVVNWEADGERVRLQVPRSDRRAASWLARLFPLPETRTIELDEVGSQVWELCDGQRTVKGIINALVTGHRLDRKEAEVALVEYLRALSKRGLVGLDVARSEKGE